MFQVTFDAHKQYLENMYKEYKSSEERNKMVGALSTITGSTSGTEETLTVTETESATITESE